ncbi:ABC transporter permease [Pedococcus aerophilus]|uniref:ABC transporter permease n=1 Tax=Pedococcus aerophilus TaxID=436356 RepID=UPI0031E15114
MTGKLTHAEPGTASPPARPRTGVPVRMLAGVLARRGVQAVSVALLVSVLCFVITLRLPGDAAYRIAAGRYGSDLVDSESAAAVRTELGLDRPAWVQLGDWLGSLVQLDLGRSLVTSRPVAQEVAFYLVGTLQLATAALVVAVVLGTGLGVAAARRPGGLVDRLVAVWVASVRAVPPFLLGLLLVVVVSAQLGLLPAVGHGTAASLVLPVTTLGAGLSGLVAGVTRDTVVEVHRSEWVRFARTKGLSERWVVLRHVVRNAAVVLVPYLGVQAVVLVEGVVVVESLFSWQGLGHALVHATFWRDVPVLQATALVLALLVVTVNTVVDLAGVWLDPRPRGAGVAS